MGGGGGGHEFKSLLCVRGFVGVIQPVVYVMSEEVCDTVSVFLCGMSVLLQTPWTGYQQVGR